MDADVFRSGVHDMKKLDHRTHYVSASFMSRMVADYSEFRPYGGYYVYICCNCRCGGVHRLTYIAIRHSPHTTD